MDPLMMSILEGGVPRIQPWMHLALGCERPNVQQQRAIDRIKEQHGGELPSDLYNQMLGVCVLCLHPLLLFFFELNLFGGGEYLDGNVLWCITFSLLTGNHYMT